jgi:diacylglycerol kinase
MNNKNEMEYIPFEDVVGDRYEKVKRAKEALTFAVLLVLLAVLAMGAIAIGPQ